jgi:IS30 family transposase
MRLMSIQSPMITARNSPIMQRSLALDARGHFAHPYHSWERGLNENMNGLIRQYLPKGKSFDSLTQEDIQRIMDKPNNRPRKCLGYKTPNQLFFGVNPSVALASRI